MVGHPARLAATPLGRLLALFSGDLASCRALAEHDLMEAASRLSKFSVSLLGSTLAGKSTLTEILTHAEGPSIGRGAQRTTRAIRRLARNGLAVTDVPGWSSFSDGGVSGVATNPDLEETMEMVLLVAKDLDLELALFLTADGDIPPGEAEFLARLAELGKPVVGICNVRHKLDGPEDVRIFLQQADAILDDKKLGALFARLNERVRESGRHPEVDFVAVHLRSRFLADRPEYGEYRDALVAKSRFGRIEEAIADAAAANGLRNRVMSLLGLAASRAADLGLKLLEYGESASDEAKSAADGLEAFDRWRGEFSRSGAELIESAVALAGEALGEEIRPFVDGLYGFGDAEEKWNRLVEDKAPWAGLVRLLSLLGDEFDLEAARLFRRLDGAPDRVGFSFRYGGVHLDTKRFDAAGLLEDAIDLPDILGTVLSRFVQLPRKAPVFSMAKRLSDFRQDLAFQLERHVSEFQRDLARAAIGWFEGKLLGEEARSLRMEAEALSEAITAFADAFRSAAAEVMTNLADLSGVLVTWALESLGCGREAPNVAGAAWLPGLAVALRPKPGASIPAEFRRRLAALLGERVWCLGADLDDESMAREVRSLYEGPASDGDAWPGLGREGAWSGEGALDPEGPWRLVGLGCGGSAEVELRIEGPAPVLTGPGLAKLAVPGEGATEGLDGLRGEKPTTEEAKPPIDGGRPSAGRLRSGLTWHPKEDAVDKLGAALKKCAQMRERGASRVEGLIKRNAAATLAAEKALRSCVDDIESAQSLSAGTLKDVKKQLRGMADELKACREKTELELSNAHQDGSLFTISLFGRTQAGKSTLMEILCRGDGSSIGRGAQRTTRDVRSYEWKGLIVRDVPGSAAFEGEEDTSVALDSARRCDMVVFLIWNDAPQDEEARCLAQVKLLAKPVLGVCNVKAPLETAGDVPKFRKRLPRVMDEKKIGRMISQFTEFCRRINPSLEVSFVHSHLRSRFLADRPEFSEFRDELVSASRFGQVEDRIARVVARDGPFFRYKSFMDLASVDLANLGDQFLSYAQVNHREGKVIREQLDDFDRWVGGFHRDALSRIKAEAAAAADKLRAEVPSFSERHYDDKAAGEAWSAKVKTLGPEAGLNALLKTLAAEFKKKADDVLGRMQENSEFIRQLAKESDLRGESVFNTEKAVRWGSTVVTGVLAIAAFIFPGTWILAAASIVVGIGGWLVSLFNKKKREEKIERARREMAGELNSRIDEYQRDLTKNAGEWLESFIDANVKPFRRDLGGVQRSVEALATAQRKLALDLFEQLRELSRELVFEALDVLDFGHEKSNIVRVARAPGQAATLLVRPGAVIPEPIREKLAALMSEEIMFLDDDCNDLTAISAILAGRIDAEVGVELDPENYCARVSLIPPEGVVEKSEQDKSEAETIIRIKLAQQIVGKQIVAQMIVGG